MSARLGILGKAFGLGTSQVLIRLICSFISVKLTAVYLGPSGLALVAQFNNLVSLGQGMLGAGTNTAVVRMTAEYMDDAQRRRSLWRSSLTLVVGLSLAGFLAMALLAPLLAARLLTDERYAWAIALAGAAIVVSMLNNLVQSALNGTGEIGLLVRANVWATVMGLVAFAPACVLWGTAGGLCGSAAAYLIALLITLGQALRSKHVRIREFLGRPQRAALRQILGFYPMLLAHATLTPLAMILVRDTVIGHSSLESGGHWQAAWRLSEVYTTIITTSVSLFFMPRLGALARKPRAMRREVWRTFGVAAVVTGTLALTVFVLRDWVVHLVFSAAFEGVQALMPVQLMGDVLKMSAWTLGFVLVALRRTYWYLAIEIVVPAVFVGGVHLLIGSMGAVGAMWAYVLASAVQLLMAFTALRKLLLTRASELEEEIL